jgi:CRP-like cAMP-binding protein
MAHTHAASAASRASAVHQSNQLLAVLPAAEYRRLLPELAYRSVRPGEILYRYGQPMDDLFFPQDAICSIVRTIDDAGVEVSQIGGEGVVGIGAVIGAVDAIGDVMSHTYGSGHALRMDIFHREMARRESFYDLMRWYMQVFVSTAMQTVACNGLHSAMERTCRWLLMMADRTGRDDCRITHETLAMMLGLRRPTITLVIGTLTRRGMLAPSRGGIHIINRRALESTSCECYRRGVGLLDGTRLATLS